MKKIKDSIVQKNIAITQASMCRNPLLARTILKKAFQENKYDPDKHSYKKPDGTGTNNYYESKRWKEKMINIHFSSSSDL